MGPEASAGEPVKATRIVIDDRDSPVFVIRFEGVATEAQFDQYLAAMTDIVRRPGLRALVYDATLAGPASPSNRKKQAAWMKAFEAETRASTVGTAFVLPSALVRGFLTAILWLQPMACPHTVVATVPEGLRWARERLSESGRSWHPVARKS